MKKIKTNDDKLWMLFVIPLSGLGLIVIALGTYHYLWDIGSNKCQMTYMYEYPVYTKLNLPNYVTKNSPQYQLYAYSEGSYTSKVRDQKFAGIPVLFLPGNGGSYRQVRSLGSVSLRKSEDVQLKIWFDYFSVDFNEELSGLVGTLLQEQTQFVARVVDHILTLYKDARKIVVVGHSMGGILARALLTRGYGDRISVIYTQATPHSAPPMAIDGEILAFYKSVERAEALMKRFDTPVVSVSGGRRDVIVPNHLASLDQVEVAKGSLAVSTTSIPRVRASTDHLCVVWCKQLVLATVRSMFDLVDEDNNVALITDSEKRASILYHHFLTPKPNSQSLRIFFPSEEPTEMTLPQWHYRSKRVAKKKFFRTSVKDAKAHGDLMTVVGVGLSDESLLICGGDDMEGGADEATTTTTTAACQTIPISYRLDEDVNAILVNLTSESDEKDIFVQISSSKKSKKTSSDVFISVESAESAKFSPRPTLSEIELIFEENSNAIHIDLSSLSSYFLVKTLEIRPTDEGACRKEDGETRVSAKLWIPWANDDLYYQYDCKKEEPAEEMLLSLATPKRNDASGSVSGANSNSGPKFERKPVLSLFKTTKQSFRITISTSVTHSIGHYFRFNGLSLIVFGYIALYGIFFSFTILDGGYFEVTASWLTALAFVVLLCFSKLTSTLPIILAEDLLREFSVVEDFANLLDSYRLYEAGIWSWATPFINFAVGTSAVVALLFLGDKIATTISRFINFFVAAFSSDRLSLIRAAFYCLWSVCLMISPLFNVSCAHLMCLLWLVVRKRPSEADPLKLDAIAILQRLIHFALSFPGLIVLVKNSIETDFDAGYLWAQVSRNFNTEHTCLGILMWTVLHFDHYQKLLEFSDSLSSDAFKLGAFCCFAMLAMTADISFYKCILFDLSLWVIAGCLTIMDRCFQAEKPKTKRE